VIGGREEKAGLLIGVDPAIHHANATSVTTNKIFATSGFPQLQKVLLHVNRMH
jgi:hypothetical protein